MTQPINITVITDNISISLRDSNRLTMLIENKGDVAGAILTKETVQNLIKELSLMVDKLK